MQSVSLFPSLLVVPRTGRQAAFAKLLPYPTAATTTSTIATTTMTTYSPPVTTLNKIPFKLLEINFISAHDLPPVSKSLHTYVVAWVNPDYKLITPVDHRGHTNPNWKFRMVFQVDDKFLRSDSSAVMIEIYNISRFSNLPIGIATVPVQILFNNPSSSLQRKPLTLQVCRPSGDAKGFLNVSVNLINTTIWNRNEMDDIAPPIALINQLKRVESMRMIQDREDNDDVSISIDSNPEIEALRASIDSKMQRLSSEVEAALMKSLYTTENWTEANCDQSVEEGRKSTASEQIPTGKDQKKGRRRRHSDGGKLFAWIGIGFEFNFICGSGSMKNHKKRVSK